ncbi:MAG: very short patch repair endonuclease [Patescibacteria group bacterium]|nr:very short patch repair endonuclease [Patescibacteria group bacterium]
MPDKFSKEVRSRIMSCIRGTNTGIEMTVFRYLRSRRIYFRKHYKLAAGRPDVSVPSRRIAVFIDGDFWHGYRFPAWRAKLPEYWQKKIAGNRARDRRNFAKLRRDGWLVVRVWEHSLKRRPEETLRFIATVMRKARVRQVVRTIKN